MMLFRFFRLPPDVTPDLRSNIIHYYFDIGWWGLYAGATAAFLAIYAARIGATPAQIGLLTALPSAISLVLSLPFAGVVRRLGAHRATWTAALVSRGLFLVYALLPFFFTEAAQVNAILITAMLITIPTTLINISFSQLLMEAIPPDWRGTVVGTRNAIFSIISFATTVVVGQILVRMAFPAGYQVVFVIGFVGGVLTAYHLYKVRPMEQALPPAVAAIQANRPLRRLPAYLPELTAQGRHYIRVLLMLFLFNITNNMVAPLVPGLLVNTMRLSDAWISIGTAASSLIVFVISVYIARLTRRTGNRGGTAIGSLLLAAQAVVLAVAQGPALYMVSVLVGGLGMGILITAQFNYHLENVPQDDRPTWLSWSLFMGSAAVLLGALAGPQVAALTGASLALVIFGGLRLLIGALIYRWG